MKKKTAKELVAGFVGELKNMNHGELFRFARQHGFDSRSGFPAFKKALLLHAIDYVDLRNKANETKRVEAELAAKTTIVLYSDAKASQDRFAICGPDGEPIWYGRFFENDHDYNGEQSSGELAAAKKAVWLAGKIRESRGEKSIRLILKVDADWLTWATAPQSADGKKRGGQTRSLAALARKCAVLLDIQLI